jgi:hypothetical protein
MLSAILSIPFVMVFEFIIMEVLSRPTAAPLASTQPAAASSDPHDVTNASTETFSGGGDVKANAELKELVSGLYKHFQSLTIKERNELETLWGLSYLQLEAFVQTPHLLSTGRAPPNPAGTQSPRHGKNAIRPSW